MAKPESLPPPQWEGSGRVKILPDLAGEANVAS